MKVDKFNNIPLETLSHPSFYVLADKIKCKNSTLYRMEQYHTKFPVFNQK